MSQRFVNRLVLISCEKWECRRNKNGEGCFLQTEGKWNFFNVTYNLRFCCIHDQETSTWYPRLNGFHRIVLRIYFRLLVNIRDLHSHRICFSIEDLELLRTLALLLTPLAYTTIRTLLYTSQGHHRFPVHRHVLMETWCNGFYTDD